VLDACAAPGGKLMAMAEMMGGGETLVAMDVHAERLEMLKENIDRLALRGVEVVKGDVAMAGGVPELAGRTFDAILLDVPCTNTGVLRRRADARWRFSVESMGRVGVTQYAILEAASTLVRSGGRLVYSTCSLEPEEGELLVSGWLATHPAFELAKQRKLFPPVDGVDGAYAALLVKR
jgi:16S rRNA (cytosine967-C5)-methyltransferase